MTQPIQNLDAEENILGACLISDKAAEKVLGVLDPEHFYGLTNGRLFRHIATMFADGIPVDPITVSQYIQEHGADVEPQRVFELATLVPATSNVVHYAKLVKDAWTKRVLSETLMRLHTNLDVMTAQEAVAALEEESINLSDRVEGKQETIVQLKDALAELEAHFDKPADANAGVPIPEEFSFLEEGLQPGRLYVLGGYQADGKTAAAMQFATAAAAAGRSVGVASLEMSYEDLTHRWVAREAGVAYRGIRRNDLTPTQRAKVDEAAVRMGGWRVDIIDDPMVDPGKLRRVQRARKYDLLIVDHLHQMEFEDRRDLERKLKHILGMARGLGVPVLLLAQLTRSGDWKNPFPPPTMRSLRESAMIEAMAAHIWFVYRKRDPENDFLPTTDARFIVAKNRFGPTGAWDMQFNGFSLGFSRLPDYTSATEVVSVGDRDIPF